MQIPNFVKKLLVLLCGTKQHREETCSPEILCSINFSGKTKDIEMLTRNLPVNSRVRVAQSELLQQYHAPACGFA